MSVPNRRRTTGQVRRTACTEEVLRGEMEETRPLHKAVPELATLVGLRRPKEGWPQGGHTGGMGHHLQWGQKKNRVARQLSLTHVEAVVRQVQAYLREIMGSVPDHRNKANIPIKWVIWISSFPGAYKSWVYTVVYWVCNSIMSTKTMYIS